MKLKNFWLDIITSEESKLSDIAHNRMKWYEENIVCLLLQNQKEFFKNGYKDIEHLWPKVKVISS